MDLVGPLAFFVGGTGASESESEASSDELRFWDGLGAMGPEADLVGAIFVYATRCSKVSLAPAIQRSQKKLPYLSCQ